MTDIQVRRGTSTQWSTANPVLLAGEVGWDSTNSKLKMGDGVTAWNALSFFLDTELNLKAPLNSPAFTGTPSGITKTHVGLGNVDNTSDAAKPVSTATTTALAGKAASVHTHTATDINAGTLPDARLPWRVGQYAAGVTDWNLALTNGWYMAYNVANAPTAGTWYIGDVVAHNNLYVTQTVHGFTTDGSTDTVTYRRSSTDASGSISWLPWYKLLLSQAEQDLRYQQIIAAGTTAQYWRGDKTWQTLDKTAVGLANVDNTSDVNKPVSTATTTALGLKANSASPTFTGTVTLPSTTNGLAKSNVGLSNVDNTADTAKPVSTAQQTALNLKADLASPAFTGTPTGITKTHVGLGSVDNTADTAKPVSTAQQTALNLKANLASPTFTGTVTLPSTTNGLAKSNVGLANVDNTADTAKPVSTAQQTALDLKANLASPAFTGTPTGITKTHVGLGNVDNTADTAKPVSTAQQTALDLKVDDTEKGAASGVATLGVDGKVPAGQLPTVAGGSIVSQIGTYAARPAANAVSIGTMYYASDIYEQYRSNGTSWVVIANGGNERGTASMTSLYSTSNGIAGPPDVPGMTVTFIAGERPVRFQVDCDLANTVDAHTTSIQVMLDLSVIGTLEVSNVGIDKWITASKGFRQAALTPGTSHTVKLRIFVSGGVGRIGGAAANPSTLSVISL